MDYRPGTSARVASLLKTRGLPTHGKLLSILGGDGRPYLRSALLAKHLGHSHMIYCVDDPWAWATDQSALLPSLQRILPEVGQAMQSASKIFAITDDLAQKLSSRLNRECIALPLPYISAPQPAEQFKNQLIYAGNLNSIYASAFAQVVGTVRKLREEGSTLVLRATTPLAQLQSKNVECPEFVIPGRVSDREEYVSEIGSSLCAILPVSFDAQNEMSVTSFPSKMLDYLAYARCILIYGPKETAAAKYMHENSLSYVASDPQQLMELIRNIERVRPNFASEYKSRLEENHGLYAFRSTVLHNLDGRR